MSDRSSFSTLTGTPACPVAASGWSGQRLPTAGAHHPIGLTCPPAWALGWLIWATWAQFGQAGAPVTNVGLCRGGWVCPRAQTPAGRVGGRIPKEELTLGEVCWSTQPPGLDSPLLCHLPVGRFSRLRWEWRSDLLPPLQPAERLTLGPWTTSRSPWPGFEFWLYQALVVGPWGRRHFSEPHFTDL